MHFQWMDDEQMTLLPQKNCQRMPQGNEIDARQIDSSNEGR